MEAHSEVRPKPGSGSSGGPSSPGPAMGTQERSEVSELVDQAKQTATETASGAGNMVMQRADDQYHKLGKRLDDVVKNLNQVADSLNKEGGSQGASNLVHGVTRQVERVDGYINSTSIEDVLDDANRYARQHPWPVIVGGMIAGLLASRFLKAAGDGAATGRAPRGYRTGSQYRSGAGYHAAV